MPCTSTDRAAVSKTSASFLRSRLHYWQICDAPAERPATMEAMIHAAREERMFPGEGGIDLVSLAKAMPADITISIEVPTATLAKTVDAERARAARCGAPGPSSRRRVPRDKSNAHSERSLMSLLGKAAVAMWWNIRAEQRSEFGDWHSHEHFPERLGIPGFRRGSRWTSALDAEGFFVLYELEQYETLTSKGYLDRLNAPTPWSTKMMPHHLNMVRSQCRVASELRRRSRRGACDDQAFAPGRPRDRV